MESKIRGHTNVMAHYLGNQSGISRILRAELRYLNRLRDVMSIRADLRGQRIIVYFFMDQSDTLNCFNFEYTTHS